MSQLTRREWKRFFELLDKIVHSDEKTYHEIGIEIIEAAHEDSKSLDHETEAWLDMFVNIFDGTLMCNVGQKLDMEMADMKAEDLIAEDEQDEEQELSEKDFR
jgi:hypothetical protein